MLLKEPPLNFSIKAEVVAVLPFIEDNILLLQRLPSHPQANLWCPPGGKIHPNEKTATAAVRELFEETGIKIEENLLIDLGKFYVRYPNGDFVFYLYKADVPKSCVTAIQIRANEHQNFCLCPVHDIDYLPLTPGLNECFEIAMNKFSDECQNLRTTFYEIK